VRDLLREISLAARSGRFAGERFRTVFFGGGTPSLLTAREVHRILGHLRARLSPAEGAEVTAEANPESLSGERMLGLRQAGVNRISLGAQSFDDSELRLLDRLHSADLVARRVRELRRAGFRDVSLDLIYGLPGSTERSWSRTLDEALSLGVDHLSAYLLTLEPDVPLAARMGTPAVPAPADPELARAQYEILLAKTAAAGLRQYEISNFAVPGMESRHNQNYWASGDYLGLGPSAHSHRGERRWANPASMERYREALRAGRLPWEMEEVLTDRQVRQEKIFLGLRRVAGIDLAELLREMPEGVRPVFDQRVRRLLDHGLLLREDDRLRLHPRAYFVSDAVFSELMEVM